MFADLRSQIKSWIDEKLMPLYLTINRSAFREAEPLNKHREQENKWIETTRPQLNPEELLHIPRNEANIKARAQCHKPICHATDLMMQEYLPFPEFRPLSEILAEWPPDQVRPFARLTSHLRALISAAA